MRVVGYQPVLGVLAQRRGTRSGTIPVRRKAEGLRVVVGGGRLERQFVGSRGGDVVGSATAFPHISQTEITQSSHSRSAHTIGSRRVTRIGGDYLKSFWSKGRQIARRGQVIR